jgi:cysteine desulfuration protein SufE
METFLKKEENLKKILMGCVDAESRYEKIIELGRQLPVFDTSAKVAENLVSGCQSIMYLQTIYKDGFLFFNCDSEALISKGLGALLVMVYSEQPPLVVFKNPPKFFEELGLHHLLSLGRSSGVASLYSKMQQGALIYLLG